jgi:hypothetical protein
VTKGFYGGRTFGWPTPFGAVGGGLYFDNHENFYPQIYYGTPAPTWLFHRQAHAAHSGLGFV